MHRRHLGHLSTVINLVEYELLKDIALHSVLYRSGTEAKDTEYHQIEKNLIMNVVEVGEK